MITLDLFIEAFGGDTVKFREVFIQHAPVLTQDIDRSFNSFGWDYATFCHVSLCILHIVTLLVVCPFNLFT